ncbi:MAG: hypothetical protein GEU91_13565 [Rhizobiales bacterium]|nr:hypothetical protein [Hyphomicrobiales bacterium]
MTEPLPLHAELFGSDKARLCGISVTAGAPVLELCRRLVAAGVDPATPLAAYRGDVLCLKVRSIGEGARLEPAGNGVGFRVRKDVGTAPPMRSAGEPVSQSPGSVTRPLQAPSREAAA